jgi:hypothetical protein
VVSALRQQQQIARGGTEGGRKRASERALLPQENHLRHPRRWGGGTRAARAESWAGREGVELECAVSACGSRPQPQLHPAPPVFAALGKRDTAGPGGLRASSASAEGEVGVAETGCGAEEVAGMLARRAG